MEKFPHCSVNILAVCQNLMIEAEFDYFKICNEEFVKKLEEQGKDVDVIYYED